MKKIGLFILLTVVLTACGPSNNAVDIAQAQSIIEAARAAQDAAQAAQIAARGISDVGRGPTLILVLLTLLVVVLCISASGAWFYYSVISRRSALVGGSADPTPT
jgi:hypothetical protein